MIKSSSIEQLRFELVLNQYMLPYCFIYNKQVSKSILRYWYKVNNKRRKDIKWERLTSNIKLEDILKRNIINATKKD